MFNLYEVGRDWYEEGTLISSHKTKELAEKRMNREAKKRVKTLNYIRANIDEENKMIIYDYGLWNRFLVIREVEDEERTIRVYHTRAGSGEN